MCTRVVKAILVLSSKQKYKNMELREIKNLSGERLGFSEFKEYVEDYYKNNKEYGIKKSSRYFKEIKYCYFNLGEGYKKYCLYFKY